MTRVSPAQVSTASGEISPQLHGRPDFLRYQNGVELQRGYVSLPEGGALRLPGTRYVGRLKSDLAGILMPFIRNETDTLMLEFTDQLIRFWREEALVQAPLGGDLELASPYLAADLANLQQVPSADRVYMVDGRQHPQWLSRLALDDWTIGPIPYEKGPFDGQNTAEADKIVASATTGAITLTASFDIFEAGHVGGFFYLGEGNQDDVPEWTGQTGAAVGQRMRNDGKVYRISSFDGSGSGTGVNPPFHEEGLWLSAKNGPVWEFIHAGFGIVTITGVTSPTVASATVISELPASVAAAPGTYRWREGLWSDKNGYPAAIAAQGDRHWYGGTPAAPTLLVASDIGAPRRFVPSTLADGSFALLLPSTKRRISRIKWIEPGGRSLHAGTGSEEISARATDDGQGLTIETTRFDADSGRGSSEVNPVNIDGSPVFVGPDGKRLYGLRYVFEDDRNVADPLTLAARHILAPGVVWMAWQEVPWRVLWLGLGDGEIVSLAYEPDQQVFGFGRHDLAAGGLAEWGAVKPTDDGRSEELWLVVARVIGGQTQRMIEVMAPPYGLDAGADAPPALADAWHLMCAARYQGAPTNIIAGLGHLEGETVSVWTEKGGFEGLVVTGAEVALPEGEQVTSAITGLDPSATQRLRYLDLQAGAQDGGSAGRLKAMRGLGVRLAHTAGGVAVTIQPDSRGLKRESRPVKLLARALRAFEPPPVFSGVVDVDPKYGWSETLQVEIRPEGGAPISVLGAVPTLQTTDG
jgi:hypothetical protein